MNNYNDESKVLVIIVNWQRPQDTIECLDSVLKSDYDNLSVLVIDNGSQDGSVNKIKDVYPEITVLELPENIGFTGGYNTGLDYARKSGANYYFLLNNDTVIDKKTISYLVNSSWDISVPKITYYGSPGQIWAAGARWRSFPPTIKMIGYRAEDQPKYNLPYALEYATGCALLIKKDVISVVSGFDPIYKNYMEDYDFSYQVREAGFQMGYVPKALVEHKESQTLGINSPQRWHLLGRNTAIFYRKGSRFPNALLWVVLGWIYIREFLQGNSKYLPIFWKGVREGRDVVKGSEL